MAELMRLRLHRSAIAVDGSSCCHPWCICYIIVASVQWVNLDIDRENVGGGGRGGLWSRREGERIRIEPWSGAHERNTNTKRNRKTTYK